MPPLQSPPHAGLPPVVVRGGDHYSPARDTIISVPESGGMNPEETGQGIISVPGRDNSQEGRGATAGAKAGGKRKHSLTV